MDDERAVDVLEGGGGTEKWKPEVMGHSSGDARSRRESGGKVKDER